MSKNIDLLICKTYKVEAVPSENGNGFVGAFSIPGKDRQLARFDDGSIAVFDTEDGAISAGGEDLCEALNTITGSTASAYGYRVMGGQELAVLLKEAGVSVGSFAIYCGTTQERVVEWIMGKNPIPRTVNLIAHLFKTCPGAIDQAQQLVDEITFRKKPAPA